ncbi:MAG: anti-sigma factor [Candidatus Binatales bacterium]
MDHQALKDLLPLAAIGKLDPEEDRALAEHLRSRCDACEGELRGFRETAAALALAGDDTGRDSEARIWNRLRARLDASTSENESAPIARRDRAFTDRPAAPRPHSRRWQMATGVSTAAALAAAIYAGVIMRSSAIQHDQLASLADRVSASRAELAGARQETAALKQVLVERAHLEQTLMAPDLQITRLKPLDLAPGASAMVAASRSAHTAVLQANAMPPAPAGKTYELWWITKETGPVAAGLFQAGAGREVIARAEPPPAGHVILAAVTLEPAGGVSKPTGAMYLKGEPAH